MCTSRSRVRRPPTCITTSCSDGTKRATAARRTGRGGVRPTTTCRTRRLRHRCAEHPSCRSSAPCTPTAFVPDRTNRVASRRSCGSTCLRSRRRANRSTSRTRRSSPCRCCERSPRLCSAVSTSRVVVPRMAETIVRSARARGDEPEFFALLGSLATHANFTLAALHRRTHDGRAHDVYVHSKVMLVDDAWATVGSCNLRSFSLTGNTELNASVWDSTVVRRLRVDLLTEHLGFDVSALERSRRTARASSHRYLEGRHRHG